MSKTDTKNPINQNKRGLWAWQGFQWLGLIGAILVLYSLIVGLFGRIPVLPILRETIRMLYIHVPMWFAMVVLFTLSCYHALAYLRTQKRAHDHWSYAYAHVGFLTGILGLTTGMLWAQYTWGSAWSQDPKQNASALGLLLYMAYFLLRNGLASPERKAQISAMYNILGYGITLPLIFVLPRLTDSLHPGNGGNPGFNTYDLSDDMRWVFYPAVLGWIAISLYLSALHKRSKRKKAQYLALKLDMEAETDD